MNKKILFLTLLLLLGASPVIVLAQGVPPIVTKIQDSATLIGTSIIIIGWVIAGILYLVAAGSPEKLGTAKKALVAAVIGTAVIILAASAEALIRFYVG